MSILRKDLNVNRKKTHRSALEALEGLIEILKSNEIMSNEMVLASGRGGQGQSQEHREDIPLALRRGTIGRATTAFDAAQRAAEGEPILDGALAGAAPCATSRKALSRRRSLILGALGGLVEGELVLLLGALAGAVRRPVLACRDVSSVMH